MVTVDHAATADDVDAALTELMVVDLDGAFERLVLAYQGRLYGFALRMTANPDDAEEIAQDAFVRAYRALGGYDLERRRGLALRPWLYRIALNVARNRARRKRLQLIPLDGPEDSRWEPMDDERGRPEAIVIRTEGEAELAALVASLPPRYRTAVVLRHVAGLGYEEAATVLGQPVGTVKSNCHRGVRLLRAAIGERSREIG